MARRDRKKERDRARAEKRMRVSICLILLMQTVDIPLLWALFVVGAPQRAIHVRHSTTHSPRYRKKRKQQHTKEQRSAARAWRKKKCGLCTNTHAFICAKVFVLLFYFNETSDYYKSVHKLVQHSNKQSNKPSFI